MELLATVTINNYIRSVEVSKARRATYYKKGEKLPTKYSTKIGVDYQWVQFTDGIYLCDSLDVPIIKNSKSVGTPKVKRINGQDLHTLTLTDYDRSKIIRAIKAQMIPEVDKLDPITKFPIRILCELHDTYMDMEYLKLDGNPKEIDWDCDNRGLFYCKTFPDVLQGCLETNKEGKLVSTSKVVIPNDHRRYITQPPVILFFPIEDYNQRKLVFKIYYDDREIILKSKYYER